MTDFLLEISKSPQASKLVKTLGLPLPIPAVLKRAKTPRTDQPLADVPVLFASNGTDAAKAINEALVFAGADIGFVGTQEALDALGDTGEAYGRMAKLTDHTALTKKVKGLVLDATDLAAPDDLKALYDFFHPIMRKVAKGGRMIVVGRPPNDASSPEQAAARHALDGFVRSLAKEVGKRGATANLLILDDGAEDRIAGPLRFFLSKRSAYVSGQPLRITKLARENDVKFSQPLAGKNVLVTGAARGIGKATARVLAGEGAKVFVLDRPDDAEAAAQLADEIGGVAVGVDLGTPDAADEVAAVASEYGGFDVVVHNAGVTRDRTLANMKPQYWDLVLNVNLAAIARITQRLVDDKLINSNGRIVCLSSTSGIAGNMGQTNYGAAKSGVIGYVQALAPTLSRRGITVNAIAPGFIETRMTAAMPAGLREVARRLNSLGQGGNPVDVGEAVTFLATPAAHGVSGQVLRVCGQALVGA